MSRLFRFAAFFLFLGFCFLLFFQPVEAEDIWWHVATGQWVFQHRHVPTYDIFSFEPTPVHGISPQWLGSCIYAFVYQIGDIIGLKIFRALIFLTAIGLFMWRYFKQLPAVFLLILSLLLAYGLATRALLRPFVFNFIFVQAFLIILLNYQKDKSRYRLYIIPILGVIWANIHMGSFVYGILLVGVFFLSSVINYCNVLSAKKNDDCRGALVDVKNFGLIGLLYLTVFFITPYGVEGGLYPFRTFLDPQFLNMDKLNAYIMELQPPDYLLSMKGLWAIVLFFAGCACIIRGKNKNYSLILLFIFLTALFLHGQRASGVFAIVSVYLLAEQLSFMEKLKLNTTISFVVLSIYLAGSSMLICQRAYVNDGQIIKYYQLDQSLQAPTSTLRLLKQNNIYGPMINTDQLGAYIIKEGYPRWRVFTDSRQYNMDLFFQYIELLENPDKHWARLEEKYEFQIALFDMRVESSLNLVTYLHRLKDWQLIAVDGSTVTFVKHGVFNLPPELALFEKNLADSTFIPEDMKRLAQPVGAQRDITDLFSKNIQYIDVLEEGQTFLHLGYTSAAVNRFVQAMNIDEALTKQVVRISPN